MLVCGVPALQSHSITTVFAYLAGVTGFFTFKLLIFLRSGEQASFWNKVLLFFSLAFKIKRKKTWDSLKWKVCTQIILILTCL